MAPPLLKRPVSYDNVPGIKLDHILEMGTDGTQRW
jgi:hypothetical protein